MKSIMEVPASSLRSVITHPFSRSLAKADHASRLFVCAVMLFLPLSSFAKPRRPIPPLPDPWPWLNDRHFDSTNLWDATASEWPSQAAQVALGPIIDAEQQARRQSALAGTDAAPSASPLSASDSPKGPMLMDLTCNGLTVFATRVVNGNEIDLQIDICGKESNTVYDLIYTTTLGFPVTWHWQQQVNVDVNTVFVPATQGQAFFALKKRPDINDDGVFVRNPVDVARVGTGSLRILSSGGANTAPALLELVLITSDASNLFFSTTLPIANQFQVTVNGAVVAADVQQVGYKRRPLFAPIEQVDLRIENSLYLTLANPIPADDALVEVNYPGWPLAPRFVAANKPLRYSPAIHVNQEGYLPTAPQKAIIGYYCGTLGQMNLQPAPGSPIAASSIKLVDAATGSDASGFNPVVSLRNEDTHQSLAGLQYQGLVEVDFNSFSTPGFYLLRVEGLGASFPFRIDDGIAMKAARNFALGLYHQRCGTANALPFTRFTHDPCHTASATIPVPLVNPDPFTNGWGWIASYGRGPNPYQTAPVLDNPYAVGPTNPTGARFSFAIDDAAAPVQRVGDEYRRDASGGHHDAGDYSKYTINSAQLIHTLVFAADNFPNVANLDNLGIPESGDGISDILQEARWEADFLVKMQDNGSLDRDGQPVVPGGFYTLVYPRDRQYEFNVLPENGDAQIVWPKSTSVSAAAVAALAEIGSSPRFRAQSAEFQSRADLYLDRAQRGWSFLMNAIDTYGKTNCFQTLYNYGDIFTHNDELVWAAAAMFAADFTDSDPQHDPQTRLLAWYPDPTGNRPIPGERCDTDPNAPQCGMQPCDNAPCRAWKWGWWRMYEGYGCAARDYAFAVRSGRRSSSDLNSTYLSACEAAITAWGDRVRSWSSDYNVYRVSVMTSGVAGYGWHPEFFFPSSWSFDIAVSDQVEGHTSQNRAALIENMNYEAGRNPNNVSFLPGLGWKRQRSVVNQYARNDYRILPPSGNPIGSIAFRFAADVNNYDLNSIYYPQNSDGVGSFALYDRWADAYNVKTEFVCPQTARCLAVAALLAAQNSTLRQQIWCSANATISFQTQDGLPKLTVDSPAPVQLSATARCGQTTLDLSAATVLWEMEGNEPTFGGFTPARAGDLKLEAEAVFPDGRRIFAFVPGVLVYDPINGGTPYPTDPNTIALYHFNGDFTDASGHGHTLAVGPNGNVAFAKAGWMANPNFDTDKVARFSKAGDELTASFSASLIQAPLTIDFRIFARGYKGPPNQILSLQQATNSQFSTYYNPNENAPYRSEAPYFKTHSTVVLSRAEWKNNVTLYTWHNIRIVYKLVNGVATTTVYIDGTFLKSMNTPAASPQSSDWTLYIGNFDGDIDEVRISNIDRGPDQRF